MMDIEGKKEFYRDLLIELLSDCIHSHEIDWDLFDNKVSGIWSAAKLEGFKPIQFKALVSEITQKLTTTSLENAPIKRIHKIAA